MTTVTRATLFLSLLLAVIAAEAETSFDYFQFSYDSVVIDFDDDNLEGDTWGFDLSREFGDRWLVQAGFDRSLFDARDAYRPRQDEFSLALGKAVTVNEKTDLYGLLGYGLSESDLATGNETEHGLLATVGVRHTPIERLQLDAALGFRNFDNPVAEVGREVSVSGLLRWYVTEAASIGLGFNYGEYDYAWTTNVRFDFDTNW